MNDKKLDELNKGIKVLIFFVIILIVLVSCFFAVYVIINDKETTKTDKKETTTTKTIASYKDYKVLELGEKFYKEYYYKTIGSTDKERANNVKKYSKIGIRVNLENIIRFYSDEQEELRESFSNYDTQETKVIIYPKEPYGVKDYTIELEIVNK